MIVGSGRGLVVRGKVNTSLFRVLFWITIGFICGLSTGYSLLTFPLGKNYPYNLAMGQICSGNGVNAHNKKNPKIHYIFVAYFLLYSIFLGTSQKQKQRRHKSCRMSPYYSKMHTYN